MSDVFVAPVPDVTPGSSETELETGFLLLIRTRHRHDRDDVSKPVCLCVFVVVYVRFYVCRVKVRGSISVLRVSLFVGLYVRVCLC